MHWIAELSWRAYPAALLIAVGVASAVRSAVAHTRRARQLRDPARALEIMRGFRISLVCLAAAATGVAWWWQLGWLLVLVLVIGGQELLESTVVITALANGPGAAAQHGQPAAASQRAIVVSRSGGSGMA